MNPQVDKSVVTTTVTLIAALVLLAVVLFMAASLISVVDNIAPDDGSRKQSAVLERIKPIARVSFEQPKPVVAVQLSAKQIYDKVCAACHATGTLGAPRVGDKAQWEPRFAQGLDTLVTHATNGIRAMPAKGGDPSLTEANLKDAIVYMLGETGIKAEATPAAEAATPAAEAAAPAAEATAPAAEAAPAEAPSTGPASASTKTGPAPEAK